MSRYRDDRDDYYGGRPPRDDEDYGRGGGDGYSRGPSRGERDREDYGGERAYRDREDFRRDYPTSAVGRRGERQDYERERYYEDERPRRDYDDGRDYFRRHGLAPRRSSS